RRHQPRVVAYRLGAEADVAETAEVAQVPTIRETLGPRLLTTEDGEHRIIADVGAAPGQDAVHGRDDDAVDPRAIRPRRGKSDRLEPFGIGRARAERIARLAVEVPVNLHAR